MLRYFRIWLSLGWIMIILMCYLSLSSEPTNFNIELKHIDKLGHFSSYLLLMFWFSQLYKTKRARLYCAILFIVMGALLEVLQGLGGVRYFEYADILANTLGVVIAWSITKGRLSNVFISFEQKLRKTVSI